uniref:50S ribosomal protein L9, chloroplastic n=1 Tax=Pyropia perforata TaxID=182771 RepID=A0A059XCJ6_PYRPE|nr:50S ribosomal protein L9 [Neoporphyra perforata]AIA19691.1 50S ribosomal protein L9 [Neoporphyra perforata]AIA19900.1 50S ribosomal protein L9 [Neoporphyra perforata]AIA20318.1 50S ribosomal protein L9 [Neoporphyra perforata]
MSKKVIKVVLKENIRKLGKSNDLVEVSAGYARNFLVPNKMATIATSGILKQQKFYAAVKEEKLKVAKEDAKKIQQLLEGIEKFSVTKKTGDGQNIFGSVTEKEISQIIKNATNIDVEKQKIFLPEIKTVGIYNIEIKLLIEVTANVQLQVLPELN